MPGLLPEQDRSSYPKGLSPYAAAFWAGALAYAPVLQNGFTFDDLPVLVQNPNLAGWGGLIPTLRQGYWAGLGDVDLLWRPVTMLSHWLTAMAAGLHAPVFLAVNLLLHGLVSALVARAALRLGGGAAGATVAGVAFAVHPIHADAVASAVGRAELLAALFGLLALRGCLRFAETGGSRRAAVALGWMLAAVGSKENAATVVGVAALALLLGVRWPDGERGAASSAEEPPIPARRKFAAVGLLLGAVVLYLLLRVAVLGGLRYEAPRVEPGLLYGATAGERFATAADVFGRYTGLIAWPQRLSADYSFAAIPCPAPADSPWGLLGWATIAACAGATLALRGRAPVVALGLGSYLLTFSLTSNFLFPIKTLMAERLAYLPSAGLALALGMGFGALWRRLTARAAAPATPSDDAPAAPVAAPSASPPSAAPPARSSPDRLAPAATALLVATLLVGLALSIRTYLRATEWHSNETLFRAVVRDYPNCARAHYNLGDIARVEKRDYAAAEQSYLRALAIQPGDPLAWVNVGLCRIGQGRLDEAEVALRRSLEFGVEMPVAETALARIAAWRQSQPAKE